MRTIREEGELNEKRGSGRNEAIQKRLSHLNQGREVTWRNFPQRERKGDLRSLKGTSSGAMDWRKR